MENKEVTLLKKALERQKKARLQAERILEEKSKELYDATNQLKESNERLENMLSEKTSELEGVFYNIIDPYIVMDIMGNILRMNGAAKELLGYDNNIEEINLMNLVHKDYVQYTQESFHKLYEVGELKNYKTKILDKDKNEKFIHVNSSIIYDKNRKPIAAQGVIRDITKEDEIEKLLAEKRKQLDIIVENSPLGIVLTVDDKIIRANNASVNLFGYTEQELKKLSLDKISMTCNNSTSIKEISNFEPSENQENYSLVKRFYKKDGSTFLAKTLISRVEQEKKQKGYQVAIIEDITEQRNLEEQKEQLLKELEASNKGLQEYAHIVSHDLKSPLRSISALSTWLLEDYASSLDENGVFQLKAMQEKVEAMDKLVDGILKYSTIKSDNLDNTKVDVNTVIKDIRDIIYIPDHVEVKTLNKLPTIFADKTKIHQLFQNIIGNAVVHIEEEKGLVSVSSKETPSHWEFSIKDNGVGIPKEYHEKIFKIFQSIGNKERSTGIGLSIVKKIIDLYDGEIWLDSEIGKGTTFSFTLKK
ncbi:PAS domain S-box-containing protein [Saonia flava]|uniref:histidine kinase n=1 Tax=Saonia flava TaxID=523696 RepID=A0A846QV01_9FLAO|nr:PAS domain-containing sensor histidine kinase [Saonia flava]NJB71047.1 PAS domain S-box-containing protein [Saonia flava]